MALQIGDDAPDFTLLSDQNIPVTLHALRGKKVVLYFYPKDNTPGCIQQACDFRDTMPRFTDQHTIVLGISKDSPNRHEKFKQKYQLPFPLLADPNGDVCEAYGVINKKSLFGRTFLGITRSTFLIDPQGKIRAIWRKVKVSGHIQQVLHETSQS
jgi:thioredoxin-dependent peroxiredoxin